MSHPIEIVAYEPDLAPNLGSLIRLGVCFDAPINVIEPCGFPFSLKLLKTRGLDYVESAIIRRHNSWEDFQSNQRKNPRRLVLLTTKSGKSIWDFEFLPGDSIVLGRESLGVPENVHQEVEERVNIPMPGPARSLNISVSAGIALAEASRQSKLNGWFI